VGGGPRRKAAAGQAAWADVALGDGAVTGEAGRYPPSSNVPGASRLRRITAVKAERTGAGGSVTTAQATWARSWKATKR
jgi:hypothetical protein